MSSASIVFIRSERRFARFGLVARGCAAHPATNTARARKELRADRGLELRCNLRVGIEVIARVLLTLADAVAFVAVPRAGLLEDSLFHPEIDDLPAAVDAFPVQDLEFS